MHVEISFFSPFFFFSPYDTKIGSRCGTAFSIMVLRFLTKAKPPRSCLTSVAKVQSNADRSGFIPIKRDDISAR